MIQQTFHGSTARQSTHSAFLDALDMAGAVQRALAALAGLHGLEALVLAIGLAALDVPAWVLAWHFDFNPTLQATAGLAARIMPSLPPAAQPYAGLISILFTLLPMLGEFCLPRLAGAGFAVAVYAIYLLSLFDCYTDWPNVVATMADARSGFDGFGILAAPAFYLARIILLAFATHGFELLAVVIGICALKLFAQSRG